ncbi:ribosomal protein S7 [Tanacetum coccineum]
MSCTFVTSLLTLLAKWQWECLGAKTGCVCSKRIVGNVYPVPDVVDRVRQQTLAVHWVLDAAKKRRGKNSLKLEECLFAEIMDAYKKKGKARKKRQELRKIDAINRSYSHFRWW